MIVRITRVKVGQRQAPIQTPCTQRYRGFCLCGVNFLRSPCVSLSGQNVLFERINVGKFG